MKFRTCLFISSLLLVVAFGCRTRKNAGAIRLDEVEETRISLASVHLSSTSYEWYDGKFSATVNENGKINNLKGRVKIRRDSAIWISVRGAEIIEVARILVTKDSVKLINYLNKEYFTGDYKFVTEFIKYPVNYTTVQSILTGEPFFLLPQKDYLVSRQDSSYILSTSNVNEYIRQKKQGQRLNVLFQALWILQGKMTRAVMYDPGNQVELELAYQDIKPAGNDTLPYSLSAHIISDTANVKFSIDYNSIELNIPTTFPFNIPKNYVKMD